MSLGNIMDRFRKRPGEPAEEVVVENNSAEQAQHSAEGVQANNVGGETAGSESEQPAYDPSVFEDDNTDEKPKMSAATIIKFVAAFLGLIGLVGVLIVAVLTDFTFKFSKSAAKPANISTQMNKAMPMKPQGVADAPITNGSNQTQQAATAAPGGVANPFQSNSATDKPASAESQSDKKEVAEQPAVRQPQPATGVQTPSAVAESKPAEKPAEKASSAPAKPAAVAQEPAPVVKKDPKIAEKPGKTAMPEKKDSAQETMTVTAVAPRQMYVPAYDILNAKGAKQEEKTASKPVVKRKKELPKLTLISTQSGGGASIGVFELVPGGLVKAAVGQMVGPYRVEAIDGNTAQVSVPGEQKKVGKKKTQPAAPTKSVEMPLPDKYPVSSNIMLPTR